MRAAWSDQPAHTPESDDPARGVRRLLTVFLVLALAAAVGAFALSERGGSSPSPTPPALFPTHFSQTGFLAGTATLAASYDADATAQRASGRVTVRGTVYVVARCTVGTIRVVLGGLTSSQPCTGVAVGVVALNLLEPAQLTATVAARQRARWGVALYRSPR